MKGDTVTDTVTIPVKWLKSYINAAAAVTTALQANRVDHEGHMINPKARQACVRLALIVQLENLTAQALVNLNEQQK